MKNKNRVWYNEKIYQIPHISTIYKKHLLENEWMNKWEIYSSIKNNIYNATF